MFKALIVVFTATIFVLLLDSSASGFGTVNSFGQHAEHERITRAALSCASAGAPGACFEPTSILNLAGGPGTFGGVGAPDSDEIFTPEAHCDDADFLAGGAYPQTRAAATAQLMACRAHIQGRFRQAVRAAANLLDSAEHLKKAEVDLKSTCTFFGGVSGRAKCDVLEGLGRTLHGAEDFYSHSNWADESDPARPVGVNNPPGLASTGVAPVLSLRAPGVSVPAALSTGCFALNPFGCRKRVTHSVLNKDEGIIDPVTGATSGPTTSRGRIGTNFARAVAGAIAEANRQWSDLTDEIVATYGTTRGNLMICAITHDDPMKDCTGRLLVIVVDSSGSSQDTDPENLRISAAQAFNDALISEAEAKDDERPDQSTSVDFDDSARLISPLGDPSRTSFAGINSDGGTDIGAGVSVAIQELTKDPNVDPRDRGGIVILTDGQDGGSSLPGALAQAQSLGIRVSFGFLSPPVNPVSPTAPAPAARPTDQSLPDYLPAILATGGSYAVIDSAQAQRSFVDLVQQNGITNLDDPSGSSPGGPLVTGLASAGLATHKSDTWTYRLRPGGTAEITVQTAPGSVLASRIHDVRTLDELAAAQTSTDGTARLRVRSLSGELQIDVLTTAGQVPYTVRADEREVLVSGTPQADHLTCSATEPSYVQAGQGNDSADCASAADTLVGGPGADRLAGGDGDDLFIVAEPDLTSGSEQLAGGAGNDTALFLFKRPKRVNCQQNTTAKVPVGRGTVRLAGIERVLFAYRACNAPRPPHVSLGRLRAHGAKPPSLVPPRPAVRASATKRAVSAIVRVSEATAVLVTTTVRSGRKSATLASALRNVPRAGRYRFMLRLTTQARRLARRGGRVAVSITTAGTLDGPRRHTTVHVRLRR